MGTRFFPLKNIVHRTHSSTGLFCCNIHILSILVFKKYVLSEFCFFNCCNFTNIIC